MRDEAIALVVALKGHTLPKEAENALNRLCNALSQKKHDQVVCPYCKNSATLGAVFFDQNCYGCAKRMTNTPKRESLTDDQYEALVEDLSEWSRYVEVDTAHQTLEKHIREVLTAHGIKEKNT